MSARSLINKAAGVAAFLTVCSLVVQRQARQAEAANPPAGRFIEVDGVRLHFIERGAPDAPPLVMLHGMGAMAEELVLSGLIDRAAKRYRVIAFDRPGYGYSERPEGTTWDPQRQAQLIRSALTRLGIERPIVFGHSWGAMVALSLGLQAPDAVRALVVLSGYFYPSLRFDTPMLATPALPFVGRLMRNTVSPLLGRLMWPLMVRRIFSPAKTTEAFRNDYPVWMSLRPGALQAAASEAALGMPSALKLQDHYHELKVPLVIAAGRNDRFLITGWHARRLHDAVAGSRLHEISDAGHMAHHVAMPQVMAAIDEAAALSGEAAWLPPAGAEPLAAAQPAG
jgi:pimeloyl-ACP methyl ester carboxylesterase